jgi:hypothetical protein
MEESGVVRLPAPFGDGPAMSRALVRQRFLAACGGFCREAELATSLGMAL